MRPTLARGLPYFRYARKYATRASTTLMIARYLR